jgi:hypothetical protein
MSSLHHRMLALIRRPAVNRTLAVAAIGAGLAIALSGPAGAGPHAAGAGSRAGTAGSGGSGRSQPAPRVPAKDKFAGSISKGTGAYAGDTGPAWIYLQPHSSNSGTRAVKITIRPRACPSTTRCLRLTGTLNGTLTQVWGNPDAGRAYRLTATGTVAPLHAVTTTGQVHGTGFINGGREGMTVTLTGAHGSVELTAQSGQVPGFTSP